MGQAPTTAHTTDARGRSVRMLDPIRLHALRRHDVIEAQDLDALVEDLQPGGARYLRSVYLVSAGAVLMPALIVGAVYWFSSPAGRAGLGRAFEPALYPVWISAIMVPVWANYRRRMARMRGVMLKHQRCPHCGYNLRGTPAHPDDGVTICSECGCAWRVERDAEAPTQTATAVREARRRLAILLGLSLVLLVCTVLVFIAKR